MSRLRWCEYVLVSFFSLFLDLQPEATGESQESETLLQTPPLQAEVLQLKNILDVAIDS